MGGGGLYGTARDYTRFVQMVLNRGKSNGARVLKAETVDLMCRPVTGDLRVTKLKTAMPQFSCVKAYLDMRAIQRPLSIRPTRFGSF